MISLGFPWALLLLPLPLAVWWYAPPVERRARGLRIPLFRAVSQATGQSAAPTARHATRGRLILQGLIWGLVVLALARPAHLGDPVTQTRAARDVVLALDLSGSMDTRDFADAGGQPQQRLAAVREVLAEFIAARDGDRMALVVFGSRAFVLAPFTEDSASLLGFLDQVAPGMAGPDTAIGDAIGLSLRLFQQSDVPDRLVLLLSDGADTGSQVPPATAADLAAQEGVVITTIGVGNPEASGADRVDLNALRQIADSTGGSFFTAQDREALAQVYATIDAQTPRETETISHRPRLSLAHWPMGAALILMLIAMAMAAKGARDELD